MLAICLGSSLAADPALRQAPVILKGKDIPAATHRPLSMYRLFRTKPGGLAEAIPFQIDELTPEEDFVLDRGEAPIVGDGIFGFDDELVFMGTDAGLAQIPTLWPQGLAPQELYQIVIQPPDLTAEVGSVYLALYPTAAAPPLSPHSYVNYGIETGVVETDRYRYQFDPANYLAIHGVEVKSPSPNAKSHDNPLVSRSVFYLKADMKYFLTLEFNQRLLDSRLEAYKVGPVRAIVRVAFYYRVLKINFEVGMFTEISFLPNSVLLPAMLYNPIDGTKSLNRGSVFYYGFAMVPSPKDLNLESNMQPWSEGMTSTANMLWRFLPGTRDGPDTPRDGVYWALLSDPGRLVYVELAPSKPMLSAGIEPHLYSRNVPISGLKLEDADEALALGESPINLAVAFDLTKFGKGEHEMSFRLFFDNQDSAERRAHLRSLDRWSYLMTRVR